jgi:hypothetical protein
MGYQGSSTVRRDAETRTPSAAQAVGGKWLILLARMDAIGSVTAEMIGRNRSAQMGEQFRRFRAAEAAAPMTITAIGRSRRKSWSFQKPESQYHRLQHPARDPVCRHVRLIPAARYP